MLQVMGTLDDCAKITDRRTMGKYLYQLLFQKYKLWESRNEKKNYWKYSYFCIEVQFPIRRTKQWNNKLNQNEQFPSYLVIYSLIF